MLVHFIVLCFHVFDDVFDKGRLVNGTEPQRSDHAQVSVANGARGHRALVESGHELDVALDGRRVAEVVRIGGVTVDADVHHADVLDALLGLELAVEDEHEQAKVEVDAEREQRNHILGVARRVAVQRLQQNAKG